MNATSLITQFNLTKVEIADFAQKVSQEILNGEYHPLEITLCLKAMKEAIDQIEKNIDQVVKDEAEKWTEKSFIYAGAKFEKKSRKTYDFSIDSKWQSLDAEKKARETMLKALTDAVADSDTGEMIYPAKWKESTFLSITLEAGKKPEKIDLPF
jgi:hypothetical protein